MSAEKQRGQARLRLVKTDDFDICSSCNLSAASPRGSVVRPHSMSLTDEGAKPTASPISASVIPVSRKSETLEAHDVMGPSLRCTVVFGQRQPVTVFRDNLKMARAQNLPRFKSLGERIRWWREHRGIERGPLAELVGLKYSTLADLENGESRSTKRLHRFAAALRLNVHYLETDDGDPEADPPPPIDLWPLPGVPRTKLDGLTRIEQRYVESAIKEALAEIEEERRNSRRTG